MSRFTVALAFDPPAALEDPRPPVQELCRIVRDFFTTLLCSHLDDGRGR